MRRRSNLHPLEQKRVYDLKNPLPSKVGWHLLEAHDPEPLPDQDEQLSLRLNEMLND
jgi:hypothetical protein